jgi:hypothetical protein
MPSRSLMSTGVPMAPASTSCWASSRLTASGFSGFVQREAAWRRFASQAAAAAARGHGEVPEMSAEHLEARTRLHGDESFVFGLDCLLDGFAVLIARIGTNGELARGRGDGFDLHQLAGVAEHRHAEQRARRVMITEGRSWTQSASPAGR